MSRASLSPEARVLLLTAAVSPNDAALREALAAGINWGELCYLARQEKATSVLVRDLVRVGVDVSSSDCAELRQLATLSVMHMLQLEQLLHQSMDALAARQIDAILLKGAGLAYSAYPSFGDRPMGDIDLLVRPHHAERAWSLLQQDGWAPMDGEAERYVGHHHLPPLFQASGRFRMEIHADILPVEHPFQFSTDTLWRHAQLISANGRAVRVLTPVHQLWHTCVHFAWSHAMQWGSWRTLRDCAAIMHEPGFDWAQFVAFAKETRAATCCFWTLRVARRTTGAAVPDDVLSTLRPPYPEFIIERLERHFISSLFLSEDRCPSIGLTRWLWELGVSPRWSKHGEARPWQVSERWTATSRLPAPPEKVDNSGGWFRRLAAGVNYLVRLSRFSLPTTPATVPASE
jgi:hypothetical protein